jgi:parallel beta-helix repeat protein
MIRNKVLLLMFVLCAFKVTETFVLAADYYVDNSCASNGNGTAQTCAASPGAAGPFNSVANAESGLSGDQSDNRLLFKKGQTFSGRLDMDLVGYGTSGHPFTISSYGTGADPIISGGNSCIYISTVDYVTVDGITVKLATYEWSGYIYVGKTAEHITIKNCIVEGTKTPSYAYYGIRIDGDYSVLENNIVRNVYDYGIVVYGDNPEVYGNEAYNNATGIYIFRESSNGNYYNNYLHDSDGFGEEYGLACMTCMNNNIYNNRIMNNHNQGISLWGGVGYGRASNNKIYNNVISGHTEGMGYGISLASEGAGQWSNNNQIFNNILLNNKKGVVLDISETQSVTNKIYNNTFYNHSDHGVWEQHANTGAVIKNNIFAGGGQYDLYLSSSTSVDVADNLYYRSSGGDQIYFNSTGYTCSEWQSAEESSAVCSNPSFVETSPSTWSDFRLQSDSPAIDVGQDLGSNYNDALDPNDYSWPPSTTPQGNHGSGWELGAFVHSEYSDIIPPSPPTGLKILVP